MDVEHKAGWLDRREGAGCMVGVYYTDGVSAPHIFVSIFLSLSVVYLFSISILN